MQAILNFIINGMKQWKYLIKINNIDPHKELWKQKALSKFDGVGKDLQTLDINNYYHIVIYYIVLGITIKETLYHFKENNFIILNNYCQYCTSFW